MIGNIYPHPEITKNINTIREMGYEKIAEKHKKNISYCLQKGLGLNDVYSMVALDLSKCIERHINDYITLG